MKILRIIFSVLIVGSAAVSRAALLKVDFTGTVEGYLRSVDGPMFSGSIFLHTDVADERPEPNNTLYGGAVVGSDFVWRGVIYVWTGGPFTIQLKGSTRTVFDSDALPLPPRAVARLGPV